VNILFIIFSIAIGGLLSIQGNINNQVSRLFTLSGMVIGISIVQAIGIIMVSKGEALKYLGVLGGPKMWISGFMGVIILLGLTKSISVLGSVMAFSSVIVGQVIFSAIIDTLGLLGQPKQPLSMYRSISIGLMLVAVVLLILDNGKS